MKRNNVRTGDAELSNRIQEQIDGYAANIMEQIAVDYLPGLGESARALELEDGQSAQMAVDMLTALKNRITDYQRQIGREAMDEGYFVRFPS